MRETRVVTVEGRRFPVLISDEKEALLAAKAAGRAIVGLWDGISGMEELRPAMFVVERLEDANGEYLERVVRRMLGLPWKICETRRLLIREMAEKDLETVWKNRIGRGFSDLEELRAYTRHQYEFYGFGFWALERQDGNELVGVAGLTVPRDNFRMEKFVLELANTGKNGEELELGYHIFAPYRRMGYAKEACRAMIAYAKEKLEAGRLCALISEDNLASRRLAEELGFVLQNGGKD